MNTHNFKIFVEALEALPEEIKNRKVKLSGIDEPKPDKPIDMSGLFSIVAKNIEGLPEMYKTILDYSNAHNPHCIDVYNSNIWGLATWDFIDGWDKFHTIGYYNIDFDKKEGETLTANDIIIYFRKEYDKYIKSEGAN